MPTEDLRELLKHLRQFVTHRETRFEVCYDWCPLCRIEAALAAPVEPQIDASHFTMQISGALRSCIDAHGPIAPLHIGSTVKRIVGAINAAARDKKLVRAGAGTDWLEIFDEDDVLKFAREVAEAATYGPQEVCAIVHEWHESALVAMSGVLDAAMREERR